jgi:hypothetical protein
MVGAAPASDLRSSIPLLLRCVRRARRSRNYRALRVSQLERTGCKTKRRNRSQDGTRILEVETTFMTH